MKRKKKLRTEKLPRYSVENYSHRKNVANRGIKIVKSRNHIWLQGITLTGDAPKGFVRIYEYAKNVRHKNTATWPLYIAKTGHKWYPIESVTEHLLNRLGTVFGIKMADSKLCIINGQLRFLSRYFLRMDKDTLVHGAEIFAGYLEDQAFVESVESANLSRTLFTLQFVEKAVAKAFPIEKEQILNDLVRLLLYDAMVGNNDRHFFNWAVVQPFDRHKRACFSPVYDTARGLFWNVSEENLSKRLKQKDVLNYVKKYCDNSRPKLGWENVGDINHFRLVEEIFNNQFYITKNEVRYLFRKDMLVAMEKTISGEFGRLLSADRISMIVKCLNYRYSIIEEIIK
ncbi:MAG: HipA domain-containing protein [Salinivirgaceae bacterium]|nr:HipA domain-containing protein [Salinivirgaceae bacterium]